MVANSERPIAESGFRPRINPNDPGNDGGGDKPEYATPQSSGIESGFYVGDRGLPWHVALSRRLNEPALMQEAGGLLTWRDALTLAGMDFKVEKWPLFAKATKGKGVAPVPRKYATVRTDTGIVLGVVGDVYRVLQNEDAFAFMDALVDDGGAKYETAGVLSGGARVFISMEVPDTIHVEGDPTEYRLYLVVANGHDGGCPVLAMVTIERAVCRNTLRIALARALRTWRVKHTTNLDGRLSEAREALGLAFKYADVFAETASAMVATSLADRQVDAILATAFPLPEPREGKTELSEAQMAATVFAQVRQVYQESPSVAPVRGTAWGVMNAVTEYYDHVREYAGRTSASSEDVKAANLLWDTGTANVAKQTAWDLLVKATK